MSFLKNSGWKTIYFLSKRVPLLGSTSFVFGWFSASQLVFFSRCSMARIDSTNRPICLKFVRSLNSIISGGWVWKNAPVIQDSNGNPPLSILVGNTFTNGGFSMAILDLRRVTRLKGWRVSSI